MPSSRPHLRSLRTVLAILCVAGTASLVACPKEQTATGTSGEQEASAADARYRGDSAVFVRDLCRLKVYTFTVSDTGAAVVYDELSFDDDGSYEAATSVHLGEEPFTCRETGTWTMDDDDADDRTSAALSIEVTSTDCAGRSAPDSFRVRARIRAGEIELSHI